MADGTFTTLRHKVIATFVEALLGFVTIDALVPLFGGTVDLPFWQQALAASVAAAVVPLKEYARAKRNPDG